MNLRYIIIDNREEIDKAEFLGIAEPEKRFTKRELVLNVNDIGYLALTHSGSIEIEMHGNYFEIEFNQDIWDEIEKNINNR